MVFALQILSPVQRRGRQAWAGGCGSQASEAVLSSGRASVSSLQASVSRASGVASCGRYQGTSHLQGGKNSVPLE